ncbi:hypothetical protein QN277_016867 [Acacia crassicarpa]|nr:hypothetical protein QN277_016867 [Acacia crassicarpa]
MPISSVGGPAGNLDFIEIPRSDRDRIRGSVGHSGPSFVFHILRVFFTNFDLNPNQPHRLHLDIYDDVHFFGDVGFGSFFLEYEIVFISSFVSPF